MVLHDAFVILLLLHCARNKMTRRPERSLRLCVRLRLLLGLLVLAQRLRQELLELSVLQRLLRLDELGLEPHRRVRDQRRATGEKCDREVERGDERVCRGEATWLCMRIEIGENR